MTMTVSMIKALLVDLDGVIYQNRKLIPGVPAALKKLDTAGLPYRFITNTTRKTKKALIEDLSEYGLKLSASQVFAAPHAALQYCLQKNYSRVWLVTSDAGMEVDFNALTLTSETPQAVIVGDLGSGFQYTILNVIFEKLMSGAELIAMHKNRYWLHDHLLKMDLGPFIAALEYAAGIEAVVVGKPAAAFFKLACEDWQLPMNQIAMVGDDLDADIGGANAAGMISIQVKTGKYLRESAQSHLQKPDYLITSFAEIPELLGL